MRTTGRAVLVFFVMALVCLTGSSQVAGAGNVPTPWLDYQIKVLSHASFADDLQAFTNAPTDLSAGVRAIVSADEMMVDLALLAPYEDCYSDYAEKQITFLGTIVQMIAQSLAGNTAEAASLTADAAAEIRSLNDTFDAVGAACDA